MTTTLSPRFPTSLIHRIRVGDEVRSCGEWYVVDSVECREVNDSPVAFWNGHQDGYPLIRSNGYVFSGTADDAVRLVAGAE